MESQSGIPMKHFLQKREMMFALTVERFIREMKEGEGHIMNKKDDDNSEWAVDEGGGSSNHKINFWANVQQRDCLLSQHPSAG